MSKHLWHSGSGPFRADQVRSGDPYELSQGHPIVGAPTGQDGTEPNGLGAAVLGSDPAAKRVGVDTGLALGPDTLRAPDIAVNFIPGEGAWSTGAPLVVEYAGRGQDEGDLREKSRSSKPRARPSCGWCASSAGGASRCTRGVRLCAPWTRTGRSWRRGCWRCRSRCAPSSSGTPRTRRRSATSSRARATTASTPSARGGRKEGREEGLRAALLTLLDAAAIELTAEDRARVKGCRDGATLATWVRRTRTATTRDEVFEG